MAEPEFDLVGILYGQHGVMYEPGAALSERVWAAAELTRRSFEKAGEIVRGQNPLLPEKAKEIVEKYESQQSGFVGSGVVSGEFGDVGHGESPAAPEPLSHKRTAKSSI
jgi:hypothetical protein